MKQHKRLRLHRRLAAMMIPLVAGPLPLLAVAPAMAQAPAAALTHGSLLVWPFDTSRAAADASLGYLIQNEVVASLSGNSVWRASGLRPDPDTTGPMLQRAIQEDTSGDVQRIVANPSPSALDVEKVAHSLGYDAVLFGSVDSVQYDPAQNQSTVTISGSLYDARNPTSVNTLTPVTATGVRKLDRTQVSPDLANRLAAQSAARSLVSQVVPGFAAPIHRVSSRPEPTGLGSTLKRIAPYLLGAIAAVAAVSALRSGRSSTTDTFRGVAPPQNASAQVLASSGAGASPTFTVALRFNPSPTPGVARYVITRHGGGPDVVLDTITTPPYQSGDPNGIPGQSYSYDVRAVSSTGGTSAAVPFLNIANGTSTIVLGQPAAPTALTAQVGGNSVILTWQPNGDAGVTSYYQVLRSTSPNGPFFVVSPALAVNSFTDSSPDLVRGRTFYYEVQAVGAGNPPVPSSNSNIVRVTIP